MAVVDDLVFLQGVGATKQTLRRWNQSPWRVMRPWIAWSAAVALALLAGRLRGREHLDPGPERHLHPGPAARSARPRTSG